MHGFFDHDEPNVSIIEVLAQAPQLTVRMVFEEAGIFFMPMPDPPRAAREKAA